MAYGEARLILPSVYSPHELEMRLLDAFGGFTKMNMAFGVWKAPEGHVFDEPVIVYDIAVWLNSIVKNNCLRAIAEWMLLEYDQQSVYLRYPDGIVEFVEEATPWLKLEECA